MYPEKKKQSLTEKIHTVANGNNLGYPLVNVYKTMENHHAING